ncbi:hypothetical protein TEA_023475 [Camellia sinensis var. sinensis]|uniref:PB1 domain-containing protein n=1 Tax=Camellia sinensis var. sinensis TaxID=542762 RepID=A0A4S4EVB0_CAMSN|nr:hypothetical protein TEA_023475 [Camellia sinensis var. sinensis]
MAMMGLLLGNFSTDGLPCYFSILSVQKFNVLPSPKLTSPAEFIVPFDQYMESVKSNYSVGMRFKMRFEGEEGPEQRHGYCMSAFFMFTGTIIGIEDADTKRWAESKWRCLKVRWDENSTIPSPERVSPWKIQPALTTAALNPLPMPRLKRPRSSMVPFSPDSSVLTREVFLASWSKTRAASRKLVEGTTTSIISSYSHSVKRADPRPVLVQQPEAVKPKDGNCRLFGIPLISYHVNTEPAHSHKTTIETDQRSVQIKGVNMADQPLPSVEQEKPSQMCQPLVRDCLRKVQGGSTRNCTKVHKRRIALGRSVDLTKFSNYEELIAELDQLFEFIGELKARNKNWLIVFTDDEGDTMLVGDDPWP